MAREAFAKFVDGHADDLDDLLVEIRREHGALAVWRCLMDVAEFHVPKLARTEITGKDGGPVITSVVDELHP